MVLGCFVAAKSLEGMKKMNECLLCGGAVKQITTSVKTNWGGKHPLTISGIPAEQCEACGEITFSLEATRLIQSISRGIADGGAGEKPDFLALPEVAALLKVSHQTIYNMVRDGRLQAQKVGREWRFHREGLDQLLAPSVMLAAQADQVTPRDMRLCKSSFRGIETMNTRSDEMTPEFAAWVCLNSCSKGASLKNHGYFSD